MAPQSQLHHRAGSESPHRDSAAARLLDDHSGGGAESYVVPEITQALDQRAGVNALPAQACAQHCRALTNAGDAELLLFVLDDDPPEPGGSGLERAPEIDVVPGKRLKLQGYMLEDMG